MKKQPPFKTDDDCKKINDRFYCDGEWVIIYKLCVRMVYVQQIGGFTVT